MQAPSNAFATDRRRLLRGGLATLLLAALSPRTLWSGARPDALDAWARELVLLKQALKGGEIGVTDWQTRIERLNQSIPLSELVDYLDIDALSARFRYASALADVADPLLPQDVLGPEGMSRWFVRVFGLRRGGAIIPHVHNHMVSAHLIVKGSFHVRTHQRERDLPDAVVLRPTRDAIMTAGEVLSMSDQRDNQHWLIAQEQPSLTFDIGVVDLPASWDYGLQANAFNMIFVDPTVAPDSDGRIVAPVLSFDQARARFAKES